MRAQYWNCFTLLSFRKKMASFTQLKKLSDAWTASRAVSRASTWTGFTTPTFGSFRYAAGSTSVATCNFCQSRIKRNEIFFKVSVVLRLGEHAEEELVACRLKSGNRESEGKKPSWILRKLSRILIIVKFPCITRADTLGHILVVVQLISVLVCLWISWTTTKICPKASDLVM